MKTVLISLTIAVFLNPLVVAQEATSELDGLIRKTLDNHPSIASAVAKLEAAETRITQAQGWPDPILSLGANNYPAALNPLNISRFPMTSTRIGILQRLPNPGTIELKQQVARDGVALTATEIGSVKLELAIAVKRLYAQLRFNRAMLAKLHDLHDVLDQLQQTATSKYESGLVPLSSVLRLQNLKDDLDLKMLDLEQSFAAGLENLYWFTGTSAEALALRFDDSAGQAAMDPADVVSHAIEHRPDFQNQRARIALANTQGRLAEKELALDITVSASYGYRWDLTDLWTAQVAIALPFNRDRERAKIREQELSARTHQLMLQSMERRLRTSAASIDAQISTLLKKQDHLDLQLIPNLHTTAQSTLVRFVNDQASLLDYLEVQAQLIRAELTRISIDQEIALLVVEQQQQAGILYTDEENNNDR